MKNGTKRIMAVILILAAVPAAILLNRRIKLAPVRDEIEAQYGRPAAVPDDGSFHYRSHIAQTALDYKTGTVRVSMSLRDPDALRLKEQLTARYGDLVSFSLTEDDSRVILTIEDEIAYKRELMFADDLQECCELSVSGDISKARQTVDLSGIEEEIEESMKDRLTVCGGAVFDDAFVRDNTPYKSVEEYREAARQSILLHRQETAWEKALSALAPQNSFSVKEEILEEKSREYLERIRLAARGFGMSEEELEKKLGPDAEQHIHRRYNFCKDEVHEYLLMNAAADYAGIRVNEAELQAEAVLRGRKPEQLTECDRKLLAYELLHEKVRAWLLGEDMP